MAGGFSVGEKMIAGFKIYAAKRSYYISEASNDALFSFLKQTDVEIINQLPKEIYLADAKETVKMEIRKRWQNKKQPLPEIAK